LEFGEAAEVLVDLLGVQSSDAKKEMRHLKCQHVRLSWLKDVYEQSCEAGMWEYAARAYLLHLVGCTIFADKSAYFIAVKYLTLFRDLGSCGNYAWGVGCLAYVYEQLGYACMSPTHQLGGYTTLVQVQMMDTLFLL